MAYFPVGAQSALGNAFALPFPLSRSALEDQIEAMIALLDAVDGDPDREDSDEDCCGAHDDDPPYQHIDGFMLPGTPEDAEDCDQAHCSAGDDGVFAGSAAPPPYDFVGSGAGDPEDAEDDLVDVRAARERVAAMRMTRKLFPGSTWQEMFA